MPSLNIDLDFPDHPKTKLLVGLLGKGSEMLLLRLWSYCGRFHSVDGVLEGITAQEIEALVGWWGQPGRMVEVMLARKWLYRTQAGWLQVHEWAEHQGHLAVFKARAKNAALSRWKKGADASSNASSNAASTPSGNASSNALTVQGSTSQNTHPPPAAPAKREMVIQAPAPPQAKPPTQAEVEAAARAIDPRPWLWRVELWRLEMEADGWKRKGHPIADWRPLLQQLHIYWTGDGCPTCPPASNQARRGILDTHTRIKQLAVIEQQIEAVKKRANTKGTGPTYTPEDAAEFNALVSRRKALKGQVALG